MQPAGLRTEVVQREVRKLKKKQGGQAGAGYQGLFPSKSRVE